MARVGIQQSAFPGGEITPRLYGRTDVVKYQGGAEAIENFVVRPEGGLIRRHGSRFAGETRDHTKKTLLVPFIVSTIQPYMLEFGNLYIRFWKNHTQIAATGLKTITGISKAATAVVTSNGHGFTNGQRVVIQSVGGMGQVNNREYTVAGAAANTFQLSGVNSTGYDTYTTGGVVFRPYEVVSPYTEADLPNIVTTQSADTLYIVHPNYQQRTLVRVTDLNWVLALIAQNKGPWAPLNNDDTKQVVCTVSGSNYDPGDSVTIDSTTDIFEAGHAGAFFYMEEIHFSDVGVTPYGTERINNLAPNLGDQYSNDGKVYECVVSGGDQLSCQIPPVHEIGEAWDAPGGSSDKALWRYLHSRWAVISLDAFVNARQMTGTIKTRLPNGLAPAPHNIDGVVAGTGGRVRITDTGNQWSVGDWVRVVGVAGATGANGVWRLINKGTNTFELEGSTFGGTWTAGSGTVQRFATFLWSHSAFSNARGWPKAVAMHEQRLCFANSNAQPFGFWASMAGNYANFMFGKAEDDEAISYNIASNQVDPIRWVMSSGNILIGTLSSELSAYGGGLGDPITPSNTRIVPQSSEGSNATPPVMCSGQVMFINRAGRKLFALSYQTDVNQYLAEDLIEFAAHLTVGRTITRMAWSKNPLSVLWCILSDGALIALTYRKEQQLVAWTRHPADNGIYESVAVIPSDDGMYDEVWVVVRRTINGATKRYLEYFARPFEPTSPTDKTSMGFVDSALQYSGVPVTSVSGLAHLEGESVQIVADGAQRPNQVVTNAKVSVGAAASNVWVGLAYTSRLRTLRPEQGAQVTAQGKTKRIPRVTARVLNSMGGTCGPADESVMDALIPAILADTGDTAAQLFTGDTDVFLASDFDLAGRIAIVQAAPFPLDILSLMPLINVSE